MDKTPRYTLAEAHKKFAVGFNGRTWELLEKAARSTEEDEEMILAAHASLYHWKQAGTAVHAQRGHWLLAHVFAFLEQPALCLQHAQRCWQLTESNPSEMRDFDLAYAQEALGRAYALSGQVELARQYYERALSLGEAIADPEDQRIFLSDLNSGGWPGIR